MYTGTLIADLMTTVERAEQTARQHQIAVQRELHEIYSMQISLTDTDRIYMGAA